MKRIVAYLLWTLAVVVSMILFLFPSKRITMDSASRVKHSYDVNAFSDVELKMQNRSVRVMFPSQPSYCSITLSTGGGGKKMAKWTIAVDKTDDAEKVDRIYHWETDPDCYLVRLSSGSVYPVDSSICNAIMEQGSFCACYDKSASMWRFVER